MWREYTPQGFLANSFVESVSSKQVANIVRALGGVMYLSGVLVMAYNIYRTIRQPAPAVLPEASGPIVAAAA